MSFSQSSTEVVVIRYTDGQSFPLRRACVNVLKQTYQNWQMVVVNDGGGRDAVESVLRSFSSEFRGRLKKLHLPRPVGMVASLNFAILTSDSDYLVIHGADDSWDPGFLLERVEYLKDPRHDAYGGVTCSERAGLSSSFLFRRSVLDTIGLLNPRLASGDDPAFNARFFAHSQVGFISR
ncbi:MAG: glycosyltransferase family A protein [Oligoflexia bacterium]|nr:glycosyltransferase family A protein [Oligoflexia bacterium]